MRDLTACLIPSRVSPKNWPANEVRYHPEFDWFNELMRFVMVMVMMMMMIMMMMIIIIIPITLTRAPAVYKHKSCLNWHRCEHFNPNQLQVKISKFGCFIPNTGDTE
jgi:hypothetical protein